MTVGSNCTGLEVSLLPAIITIIIISVVNSEVFKVVVFFCVDHPVNLWTDAEVSG